MERRMRKYSQGSPERSRERTEPPPKHHHHHHHHHHPQQQHHNQPQQQVHRVPVVYYLCRNQHLEHPHFIEVPTSSPEGLYLRDVINRLNVQRGKGMAAMYSWSCKRSYKNGFVWHDISEDDLILPGNGDEYVLKGSELLDASPSDRSHHPTRNTRTQCSKRPQQEIPSPSSSRSQDTSPSSSGVVIPEVKASPPHLPQPVPSPALPPLPAPAPEDELSPQNISPQSKTSPPLGGGSSPSTPDHRVRKACVAIDASTQTEEIEGASRRVRPSRGTHRPEVSAEERSLDLELDEHCQRRTLPHSKGSSEICRDVISSPPASASSSGGKMETLESLIRAEARKMNSFRILEEEELLAPTGHKLKVTNMLMQLITCGSTSVKGHHSFGFVPTYKPRFSHVNFPSPIYSSSMALGELDSPSKNSGIMGLTKEEKDCHSGSLLVETKRHKEGGEELVPTLELSSSYNTESPPGSAGEKHKVADSACPKCLLPRTTKTAYSKQSKNETLRSPRKEGSGSSPVGVKYCHQCTSLDSLKKCSKRTTDTSTVKGSSSLRLESCQKDTKESVFKIEERLSSGARIIIQSRTPCDDSEDSSSP